MPLLTRGSNPRWWQPLLPHYGMWGGVGWSGGRWNNDPADTDWSVKPIDAMDDLFKWHDWAYQHNLDRDTVDWNLVCDLKDIRPVAFKGRWFRLLAIVAFTVWPRIRAILGKEKKDAS